MRPSLAHVPLCKYALHWLCTVRYSLHHPVYLSATYRLKQEFSGLRLAYMLAQYPQTMTDMWPYLRLRERELFERRQMYDASFLSTYFRDRNPISPLLWTSPDHDKQIVIAVRFVTANDYNMSTLIGGGQIRLDEVVVYSFNWSRPSGFAFSAGCQCTRACKRRSLERFLSVAFLNHGDLLCAGVDVRGHWPTICFFETQSYRSS